MVIALDQILISAGVGIISSLMAAYLYFKFSYSLKPKIEISDYISRWKTSNGIKNYSIKIVNRSNRNVMNVSAQFFSVKQVKVLSENGKDVDRINEYSTIELVRSNIMELKGKNSKDKFAPYEFRFSTLTDLDTLLNSNADAHLKIEIYCQDAKTSFGKVFSQNYSGTNKIKKGPFKSNHSLEIEWV
tara:strand:+ start:179 stop:739 length:561 start_codon:yes stop_codon:yes gene_type:complete